MSGITDEEWQKMSPEERQEYQIKNCVFCKIIKGEIPSKKIYDDSDFVGLLDINPAAKGHVLLLSKKHVQIMPQLGTELNGKLGIVCKNISSKIKKGFGINSTSIFVANGAVAGQNAPHFMAHIIPRKNGDDVNLNPSLKEMNLDNVNQIRKKFISTLGLPDLALQKPETKTEKSEASSEDNKDFEKEIEKTQEKILDEQEVPRTEEVKETKDKELLDKISKMFD